MNKEKDLYHSSGSVCVLSSSSLQPLVKITFGYCLDITHTCHYHLIFGPPRLIPFQEKLSNISKSQIFNCFNFFTVQVGSEQFLVVSLEHTEGDGDNDVAGDKGVLLRSH